MSKEIDTAFFDENGYLVIEGLISEEECDILRDRIDRYITSFDPSEELTVFSSSNSGKQHGEDYFLESGDKIRCFLEEEAVDDNQNILRPKEKSINKIGHALHFCDPIFKQFSHQEKIAKLLESLSYIETDIVCSMYIFKQPQIGGAVHYHQDSCFLYTEPKPIIALWFALEDATQDNGCLSVIPGSHDYPLKQRFIRKGNECEFSAMSSFEWPEEKAISVPVKKGSIIVMHGHLVHASPPNRSNVSRHAYIMQVMDKGSIYKKDNWLQNPPSVSPENIG